ncbi:MAG TPA: ABC transporter ATP-binding protein [Bacillota bacterium]|nr:ABC transporter ATP-binding protein [Bacillota bacterium]HPT87538.1 ABC transporter ATP-binding protein [Bacillota bacterium]
MLKVHHLSYVYNQHTPLQIEALHKVSFSVVKGETIGVIGPSGSGKSCLFRCIAGVLETAPGMITWEKSGGVDPVRGLVIQEPEQQFFLDNLLDEVGFALSGRNYTQEEREAKVKAVLASVGYEGSLKISPFRLSGGWQRRVALASILVMEPEILLLDEPTVGLDAAGLTVVEQIVAKERNQGHIVFISSHDLDFLYHLVDRFLVLVDGRLVADFEKAMFGTYRSLLERLGIGIPERVQLEDWGLPPAFWEGI